MPLGWLLFAIFTVILQLFTLYCVARGPWWRAPFVLVFCAAQLIVVCCEAIAESRIGRQSFYLLYWTGDTVAHIAILALIISLIYMALKSDPLQRRMRITTAVIAGVVCFALFSVFNYRAPHLNQWMTPISRNLSFCEEVLNLILWTVLLQRRASDYLLLMVTAGIGVQVTGEVIGITLRLYTSGSTVWIPNTLVSLSEILCLVIWIWAFRSAHGESNGRGTPAVVSASGPA